MKKWMEEFWNEEEAMGTVEIVLIIAVLIAIALAFRKTIIDLVGTMLGDVFNGEKFKDVGKESING